LDSGLDQRRISGENAKIKGSISKLVLQAIISRFLKKNFART